MGRYTLGDRSWTIERDDTTITQTLDGETTVEQLASRQLAATRFNILIDQHVRAGWRLVRDVAPAPVPAKPLPKQPVVYDARNPELEAAVAADPEALEPMLLLGDWLQQQGDPRGELIALRHARMQRPRDEKLRLMIDAFEAKHRDYFVGSLDTITLGLGFAERITVTKGKLVEQLLAAFALPACRYVTSINIEGRGAKVLGEALRVIARDAPASLRHVRIGGRIELATLGDLVRRLPELCSLAFANVDGVIREQHRLTLAPACVAELVRAPMPRLESLRFDVLGVGVAELRPLFARMDLPKLTELVLCTEWDADLFELLAGSRLAAQLEVIELAAFVDYDINRIAKHRAAFPRLSRFGVSQELAPEDHERLRAVYPGLYAADNDD